MLSFPRRSAASLARINISAREIAPSLSYSSLAFRAIPKAGLSAQSRNVLPPKLARFYSTERSIEESSLNKTTSPAEKVESPEDSTTVTKTILETPELVSAEIEAVVAEPTEIPEKKKKKRRTKADIKGKKGSYLDYNPDAALALENPTIKREQYMSLAYQARNWNLNQVNLAPGRGYHEILLQRADQGRWHTRITNWNRTIEVFHKINIPEGAPERGGSLDSMQVSADERVIEITEGRPYLAYDAQKRLIFFSIPIAFRHFFSDAKAANAYLSAAVEKYRNLDDALAEDPITEAIEEVITEAVEGEPTTKSVEEIVSQAIEAESKPLSPAVYDFGPSLCPLQVNPELDTDTSPELQTERYDTLMKALSPAETLPKVYMEALVPEKFEEYKKRWVDLNIGVLEAKRYEGMWGARRLEVNTVSAKTEELTKEWDSMTLFGDYKGGAILLKSLRRKVLNAPGSFVAVNGGTDLGLEVEKWEGNRYCMRQFWPLSFQE